MNMGTVSYFGNPLPDDEPDYIQFVPKPDDPRPDSEAALRNLFTLIDMEGYEEEVLPQVAAYANWLRSKETDSDELGRAMKYLEGHK